MRHRSFYSAMRGLAYVARRAESAKRRENAAFERSQKQRENSSPKFPTYRSNGLAFESEIARQLNALGWETKLTPATGDFGADIIAKHRHELLVVQCKDWTAAAGISCVQQATYARIHYKANIAAVIVSGGFTKAAYIAAATSNILLLNQFSVLGSTLNRRLETQANWVASMSSKRLREPLIPTTMLSFPLVKRMTTDQKLGDDMTVRGKFSVVLEKILLFYSIRSAGSESLEATLIQNCKS